MKALDELLKSKKYKKIPFQFLKTQHLLLKAEINGVKGRFILDTGASHSCLNRDVKDKFLVQTQPSTTTAAGAGAVNMETLLSVKNSLKIGSWKKEEFSIKKGPIFANLVLADEINRAPAKVQSALLEAMQERQVTIGQNTYSLEEPFLVLATQNPIEQEGTYPLPEAQVDRFMLKVVIDYPKLEEEKLIIRQNINGEKFNVKPILRADEIIEARKVVRQVYLDEKIERYIVDIVFATRFPEKYDLKELKDMIGFGGSPRASINLALAARTYAFIKRRGYVIPEDVRAVAHDVLRHRIGLTYEAEANNMTSDEIISKILNKVEVP